MSRERRLRRFLTIAATMAACWSGATAASAKLAPPANPWLHTQRGMLNMAHQGGELEAPSSTLYAFRTALEDRGADSLEMDIHRTADDRLVVLHDPTTYRNTEADLDVRTLSLAQVQALDAAYWFAPGEGQYDHGLPESAYVLRGVRTGDKQPPAGYAPEDFRIPTMEEVLDAFPDAPMNVDMKLVTSEPEESVRTAELFAEVMNRPKYRRHRLIAASFDQTAVNRFHELAPHVDVSASVGAIVDVLAGKWDLDPRPVAFQVPTGEDPEIGPPGMLKELGAQTRGYAVHPWIDHQADENDAFYAKLKAQDVQGIFTMAPSRLHEYLCGIGERRPDGSPRCPEQAMTHRVAFPSRSLRKLIRGGLPVRIRCSTTCRARVEVRVAGSLNRRLRLGGGKVGAQARIGDRSQRLRAGEGAVKARLASKAARRLSKAKTRRLTVKLVVTVNDATGWKAATVSRSLKLR